MSKKEDLIEELIALNPCPKCNGEGSIQEDERDISFGEKEGTVEVDMIVCDECNGRRTLMDLDFDSTEKGDA